MRILVAAVGRFGRGRVRGAHERALFDRYARRISPPLVLKEVTEERALPPGERKKREAKRLLAAVPEGAVVVVLDERGRTLTSAAFARRIGGWRDSGVRDLAFLIGGTDGMDESVIGRAGLVLSLGSMTWPHLLVRGMLAEQIYRAQTILSGHPYHRG